MNTCRTIIKEGGELRQLVKDSRKYLVKKYPKQKKVSVELMKYHLWDLLHNLEEVFESGSEDFFVFYNDLYELFESYAKFLQYDLVPVHKLRRFLINKISCKRFS